MQISNGYFRVIGPVVWDLQLSKILDIRDVAKQFFYSKLIDYLPSNVPEIQIFKGQDSRRSNLVNLVNRVNLVKISRLSCLRGKAQVDFFDLFVQEIT